MITSLTKQRGATLVEILVTMFILAIGLLGVAGLQSVGLRQTTVSQMDVHAQLLVQDLAEMIVASDVTGNGDYVFANIPTAEGTDCAAAQCTNAQLAQYNVFHWSDNMQPSLPSVNLTITHDDTANAYTIILTWDSERAGASYTASTCTIADGLNPGCFAMLVGLQGA